MSSSGHPQGGHGRKPAAFLPVPPSASFGNAARHDKETLMICQNCGTPLSTGVKRCPVCHIATDAVLPQRHVPRTPALSSSTTRAVVVSSDRPVMPYQLEDDVIDVEMEPVHQPAIEPVPGQRPVITVTLIDETTPDDEIVDAEFRTREPERVQTPSKRVTTGEVVYIGGPSYDGLILHLFNSEEHCATGPNFGRNRSGALARPGGSRHA